jgi:hypothetical protein
MDHHSKKKKNSGSGTMTSVFYTRIIVRITTETELSHKEGRQMIVFSCDAITQHSKHKARIHKRICELKECGQ